MNVLIVDDEQHAREAVKLLVDWSRYEIGSLLEADNGEEAKRLMTEVRPELVLTDMHMPISDGKELLEWIAAHYPDTQIIVISGYSDFEYMRHTVKYGGSDYLLKPLDPEQLNEAVRKSAEALDSLKKDRLKHSMESIERNQYKPIYWDKMFSELLHTPSLYSSMWQQLHREFGCPPEGTPCRTLICSLEFAPPSLLHRFRGDRDLLAFAVTNVINDLVRLEWNAGYAFRYVRQQDSIVVLLWSGLDQLVGRLDELLRALAATIKSRLPLGIGTVTPFPAGAGQSADEAGRALRERNLVDVNDHLHWFGGGNEAASPLIPRLAELEEPLRLGLLSRRQEDIAGPLRQWMGAVRAASLVTPSYLELWKQEFQFIRSKWQQVFFDNEPQESGLLHGIHFRLPIVFDEEGRLSLSEMERELTNLLLTLSEAIAQKQRQERNVAGNIVDYIGQHINEDLSLHTLSGKFFLSREYISRRFKQDMGCTLSEYVERLRMEKAKQLLGNPQLKIADIAEMVGYTDEKYFSKVFKKQTGSPPNRFRKNKGE